jgi:hypothetical protein
MRSAGVNCAQNSRSAFRSSAKFAHFRTHTATRQLYRPPIEGIGCGSHWSTGLVPDGQRWLASVAGEQVPPFITVIVNLQNARR